jgi:ribosome biogenesis protein
MKLGPNKNWTSTIRKSPHSSFNLATGSYDGAVKVWDVRSITSVYTLKTGDSKIFGIDWAKNMIVSGGEDTKLHIYMEQ